MFIFTIDGRTSMELTDTFRTREEQLRRSLGLLNGVAPFSFLLFYVPDDAGWPDRPGFNIADYEGEYIQSAGTADEMMVEVRRRESDGVYRQYGVGLPGEPARGSVEVRWDGHTTKVPSNEVFDADEAAAVYRYYFNHRSVPAGYSLRELNLG